MRVEDSVDRAIDKLAELWRREQRASRRQFAERRAELNPEQRAGEGVALLDLEIADTSPAAGGRLTLWLESDRAEALDNFEGRNGAPVVLWYEEPSAESSVDAVIRRRKKGRLAVVARSVPDRFFEGRFHLDLAAPQVTFRRGQRALERFRHPDRATGRKRLREVLYEKAAPKEPMETRWEPFDEDLNPGQREAVEHALGARTLALVHGPPGTGKTRTLVEIIRQFASRGERVLAGAASNAAVDNLVARLGGTSTDVVRLGHPARIDPQVVDHTLDARLEATEDYDLAREWLDEAQQLRRRIQARVARGAMSYREKQDAYRTVDKLTGDAKGHLRRLQQAIIDGADVICTTATGAATSLLDEVDFDVVVIDEATQATDPVAMVAMAQAPKVVMAGDPHQLPPTVIDMEAAKEGLASTFFERLSDHAVMLKRQYRMHEDIMSFSSRIHYGDELTAHDSVRDHRLVDLESVPADPTRSAPVVFVDAAGKGWTEQRSDDDPSTSNPKQAERVAAEAKRLLGRGLAAGQLAVITPYAAQVRLLRDLLEINGLEVGTVDGFQGREKEAIIVDLVRCNDDCDIGFLSDTRRMNVALTRARRYLCVVGDSATIGDHHYYAEFLDYVRERGEWVSAWADAAEPWEP